MGQVAPNPKRSTRLPGPAHLAVLPAVGPPRIVALGVEAVHVGRDATATICLPDAEALPLHATIRAADEGYVVVRHDGVVRVNGLRVRQHRLHDGDLINVGRSALSFRVGAPPQAPTPGPRAEAMTSLQRLSQFSRRLALEGPTPGLTEQLLADVVQLTGADRGILVLFEGTAARSAGTHFADAEQRVVSGSFDHSEAQLSKTAIARITERREPLLWTGAEGDRDLDNAPSLIQERVRALMCAPIQLDDQLLGALYVSTTGSTAPFDGDALGLLNVYAHLAVSLLTAAARVRALAERAERAEASVKQLRESPLVGSSPPMAALQTSIGRVAQTTLSVLVVGETGAGKEVVAREIHRGSQRRDGPFVAVNCAAIPTSLLQSELFGHLRGAFTGAAADRVGQVRAAHNGTLFLDEIGELGLEHQPALLRMVETREVTPVGGSQAFAVDFRLICATNRDLARMVDRGEFREDLYYRIAGVTLAIPPLRDRGEDALELATHFLKRERTLLERPQAFFSAAALSAMRQHDWPGNVRELQAAVRRAINLSHIDALHPEDLGIPAARVADEPAVRPLAHARDEYLKVYVREVVQKMGGNRTAAAAALMVTPRTIYRYLEEL